MKLRLLISILFVIATTATAVHELEHIHDEHTSSSCQVCIVDDHLVSADIVDVFKEIDSYSFKNISSQTTVSNFNHKNHSYQTRAPPKIPRYITIK
ncbi:MAG: hypothetical protein KAT78_07970 [Flavobacteriaceae bacterium]|nr:hypothetical protein [Flavobacteriaceae bacterium]